MKSYQPYKYLLILSAFLVGLGACKKDFLDLYPQTTISPEVFFKSEEDLSLYINGLLNHPGTSAYFGDNNSDNEATTAAIEIKTIMTGTPTAKNTSNHWSWSRLRNINYFLHNYNKAEVAQEVKDHYAGLARYYRALFYVGMVKWYSDVPLYTQLIDPNDTAALYMARTPRSVVMDSVMADFEFAATHVRSSVSPGTPGLWAVKTMYARAALYEGTFRKYHPELKLQSSANSFLETAQKQAEEIMAAGTFSIYSTGNPDKDYGTLFNSQDLSGNKEVILNTPYDYSKKGAPSSNINSNIFGDYENSPSRDLVQAYLMIDGSPYTSISGYQENGFVAEFKNRDPRLAQTIVPPGFVKIPDTKPYIQRLNKNFTGYHQLKGYNNATDNIILGSVDYPALRYAEVLLIYAEASAELGSVTQNDVNSSINMLRARAGVAPLDMSTTNAHPDPVLAAKYPSLSSNNKGLILEIRRERRVELAMEGFRYDDLMRWHAGKVLTHIPEGMYFPGLGKYDLTGDGEPDIMLIGKDVSIPAEGNKEKNGLGIDLVYYKAGSFGENVTVYLKNGQSGGPIVTETNNRQFIEPKYYYRPIPYSQIVLNPNLKQIFDWQ